MPAQDTTQGGMTQDKGQRLPPGATSTPPLPPGARIDPNGKMAQKFYDAGKEQKELPNLWSSLSQPEKDQIFTSLPAADQVKLTEKLKMFGHATGISAAPEFNLETVSHVLAGEPLQDPWIRQKVSNLIYKTHNLLPAVGGTAGGIAGGLIGEAVWPAGGGVAGSIIGAGMGGGGGEAARQGIEHGMGWEDEPKTAGDRIADIGKEGAWQAALEVPAQFMARFLRPSMSKAIAKLYYAGGLDVGDRRIKGAVEAVYDDLARVERSGVVGKGTTVGGFIDVTHETKRQIGVEVNSAMVQPITQNGRQVWLGYAEANTTGIQNSIRSLLTKNPSIVKEARMNPTGKEAAYLQHIRDQADKYAKAKWNFYELTDKRIRLNQDLDALYSMPRGEQRKFLLDHPDLQIAKEEADAIRDTIYPQMDLASKKPPGTTERLQTRRGIIMELSTDAEKHLRRLATRSRQAAGMPLGQKLNISTYGTSTGHPGLAAHRLHRLLPGKTEEEIADKQVARAFGHTAGTKIGRLASSKPGMEVLNLPLRALFAPDTPNRDDFVTMRLPELTAEAKQRNRAGQSGKIYRHTASSPNGHRIGSDDEVQWFDLQTGQRVK